MEAIVAAQKIELGLPSPDELMLAKYKVAPPTAESSGLGRAGRSPNTQMQKQDRIKSIIAIGESGRAYYMRQVRGSRPITGDDLMHLVERMNSYAWRIDTVPRHEDELMVMLDDAFRKYLYYRKQECLLLADAQLTLADKLAKKILSLQQ